MQELHVCGGDVACEHNDVVLTLRVGVLKYRLQRDRHVRHELLVASEEHDHIVHGLAELGCILAQADRLIRQGIHRGIVHAHCTFRQENPPPDHKPRPPVIQERHGRGSALTNAQVLMRKAHRADAY